MVIPSKSSSLILAPNSVMLVMSSGADLDPTPTPMQTTDEGNATSVASSSTHGPEKIIHCGDLRPGAVIIYKLQVNTPGKDEIPNECFTLLNMTDNTVDLRGISICDEQVCWVIPSTMVDAVIAPGETWTVYESTYNPTSNTHGIALRNTGETVRLECGSIELDRWSYSNQSSREGQPITRSGY